MGKGPTFSKGKNNVFFQPTTIPNTAPSPPKGNMLGVGDQRTVKPKPFGKGYVRPNQLVDRPNQPPKSANWQGLSRPYQAKMGLRNGLGLSHRWPTRKG